MGVCLQRPSSLDCGLIFPSFANSLKRSFPLSASPLTLLFFYYLSLSLSFSTVVVKMRNSLKMFMKAPAIVLVLCIIEIFHLVKEA